MRVTKGRGSVALFSSPLGSGLRSGGLLSVTSSLPSSYVNNLPLSACYSSGGSTSIHDLLQQLKAEREKDTRKEVPKTSEEGEEEQREAAPTRTTGSIRAQEQEAGEEEEDDDMSTEELLRALLRGDDEEDTGPIDWENDPRFKPTPRRNAVSELRETPQGRLFYDVILRGLGPKERVGWYEDILEEFGVAEPKQDKDASTSTAVSAPKRQIEDLKYFYLYNKRMRQWVIDSKTPRGYFNTQGRWEPRSLFPTYDELIRGTERDDRAQRLIDFEKEKSIPLPKELRGVYRFGVTEEELEAVGAGPVLRDLLSFRYAFRKERNQERIRQVVEKWGRHIGDTGSSEVQISAMTIKIRSLNEYLKTNHKNQVYKRHLQMLIDRRRKLLRYLKEQNVETYYKLLLELGLRDVVAVRVNRKAFK